MAIARLRKLSKPCIQAWVAAAALMLPVMYLQAQPSTGDDGPRGSEIACTIQDSSGLRACDEPPPPQSCDAEASYASQPSNESTGITFVNHGENPVKVYWLNFQGGRVLYKSLPPGGGYTQQTFIGHNWIVTTSTEQCIGIFATAPPPMVGDASVNFAPPAIPDYEQPPPPEDDLVWTPGYWAWGEDTGDYYWVPGTWAAAPIVGYLWTPGYWLARRGAFIWQPGYWGPHVGFYGGVYYGHGYFGRGFVGGSWRDGRMMYNSAVTNVGNLRAASVYNQPAGSNAPSIRASYSGAGGTNAQPSAAELAARTEYHIQPTTAQLQQVRAAHNNPAMRAGVNNGRPPIGATSRPGESLSAPMPSAQHPGTFSVMHSEPPPQPARPAGSAIPNETRRQSPTHAAPTPARPPVAAPVTERIAAPAEKQSVPQEVKQPPKSAPKPPPRTEPHAEGHSS